MAANLTLISRECFDSAFAVGMADAEHLGTVNEKMIPLLENLSGKIDAQAVNAWNQVREAFIQGFCYSGMLSEESASRRWTRLIEALGYTKPQTPEAAKKAAQRAKAAPGKVTKADGAKAAAKVAQAIEGEADRAVAGNARLTACLELLKRMDTEHLIRAQNALLELLEAVEADTE